MKAMTPAAVNSKILLMTLCRLKSPMITPFRIKPTAPETRPSTKLPLKATIDPHAEMKNPAVIRIVQ